MIKAIVFDLDDTLFPEHEFVLSGFQVVSKWLATRYTISGFFEVAWQLFKAGKRNKIFDLALEHLQIEPEAHIIQELVQIYRQHKPIIYLHKDAKWAISHFKNKYKKLGIITDGYLNTQQNKVKALQIESSFNAIIYSDFYGRQNWKPSPIPYQEMMQLLSCKGKECVYIGDNPRKDFVTAKTLDWLTVQICREDGEYTTVEIQSSHTADVKISSLTELEQILL